MLRAIIIDDESYMLEEIRSKLIDFFLKEVVVVAEAASVEKGLVVIEKFEPDLLLLDVHLLDGTGFDLIQKSEYKDFTVIFITGYDTDAIEAIKVGALDYILKPIDDAEFIGAVDKALHLQDKEKSLEKLISVSNNHYTGVDRNHIILKTSDSIYMIDQEDIIYCKSDEGYTTVYTQQSGEIMVSGHIKKMEDLIPQDIFIRCHQSYLVNKNHVIKYSKRGHLLLKNDIQIPVSARRREITLRSIFK